MTTSRQMAGFHPPEQHERDWPSLYADAAPEGGFEFSMYAYGDGKPTVRTLHATYADALQQVVYAMRNHWKSEPPDHVWGWDPERC